jgi:sensor histidine kinase YesM
MIKDTLLRLLFIPMLGLVISYISGIITYDKYTIQGIVGGSIYFIFTSFCIWRGCQWIHLKLRQFYTIKQNPFSKIISVCVVSALYSSAVAGIFSLTWMKVSKEVFRWEPVNKSVIFAVLGAIVFTLVYEILYLSKERELANDIADQLDDELTRAEMTALRNELDPHFIFNSLNTLSHLIGNDSAKANLFNNKLAQVYKYFLVNKDKELVPVDKEIEFIKNYFFLLQIRHEDNIGLRIDFNEERVKDILIIPCALQLLVENAIKHNEISTEHRMDICIRIDDQHLRIQNTLKQKPGKFTSTKVGLKNLGSQYLLVSNKNISVEENEKIFTVKLPLIKLTKTEFA